MRQPREAELADLALSLVNIPSVSREEQDVTAWIADRLTDVTGVRIVHRQADAIIFGPPGVPDVVLAGHSDTVPEQGNLPGRLVNRHVHGLGASDMKGSLAVMLALAGELHALPLRLKPLFVIFGREELSLSESVLEGLFTSCASILQSRLAIMMEPTANRLEAGCLGNIQATLEFSGIAAHSARPWLGVNAIHEAVRGLSRVADLRPEDVVLDGLTFREVLSVTEIAGGVANNVIPDRVACGLNFRYAGHRSPPQAEARLRELVGTSGDLRIESNAPAAPAALANPLVERLRSAGGLAVEPKQAWTPVAEFAARGLTAMTDTLTILRRFLCS